MIKSIVYVVVAILFGVVCVRHIMYYKPIVVNVIQEVRP